MRPPTMMDPVEVSHTMVNGDGQSMMSVTIYLAYGYPRREGTSPVPKLLRNTSRRVHGEGALVSCPILILISHLIISD